MVVLIDLLVLMNIYSILESIKIFMEQIAYIIKICYNINKLKI